LGQSGEHAASGGNIGEEVAEENGGRRELGWRRNGMAETIVLTGCAAAQPEATDTSIVCACLDERGRDCVLRSVNLNSEWVLEVRGSSGLSEERKQSHVAHRI
jgi:hypothetical protein